jgi:magnesium transporter
MPPTSLTPAARTIATLLRNTNAATLRNALLLWPVQDVAGALGELPTPDQVATLRALPPRAAAATIEYLPQAVQRDLLPQIAPDDLAAMHNAMAADDRTLFLSALPDHAADPLLSLLDDNERARTEALLAYPPDSVGRLLTPEFVALRAEWTVAQALEHIRLHGRDSETLDVLYVIDHHGALVDDLRIRELLLVPPATSIGDLMNRRFVALAALDTQRTAIETFRAEGRTALPVIDKGGLLIGIVTIDDVLDAAQELATRDLQRFGGTAALEEPYMAVPLRRMIGKRGGWLVVLLVGEMLTATAMGYFEQEIARAVVLALFVPLIISSGGNSGSQASTLVIRALALGEVSARDWWRVARRELAAGSALGALLGGVGFLRIAAWAIVADMYGSNWLLLALTVAVTLAAVVLWGALVGAMLPLVLRRMRVDPATASAPAVATLVDVTGIVIYFSVAVALLDV